jgi:hypothetical protein
MKDALGHGSNARGGGQLSARAERVALNRRIDESHFPSSTPEQRNVTSGMRPSGTANAISQAQSAARAGLGIHSAGIHAIKGSK